MIVVDASVAVKWFVQEAGRDAATMLLRSGEEFLAPDLVILETLNVSTRKQRSGLLTDEPAYDAISELSAFIGRFVPSATLAPMASWLARTMSHSEPFSVRLC